MPPAVWGKSRAVNLQAFGSGTNAIKYLGAYVGRSVIGDRRIVAISDTQVTYRWKDRAHGSIERLKACTANVSTPAIAFPQG